MDNNYKVGDIEFRYSEVLSCYEIVRWAKTFSNEEPYCYAIAFFDRLGSGYNISSVGSRLLEAAEECIETLIVWRYAEEFLHLEFMSEEERKDLKSPSSSIG